MQYTVAQIHISKNDLKACYKNKAYQSRIEAAEDIADDAGCDVEKVLLKILVEHNTKEVA